MIMDVMILWKHFKNSISDTETNGKAYIFDCRYSTLCRQIVTDEDGRVQEFDFDSDRPKVTLKGKIENRIFKIPTVII